MNRHLFFIIVNLFFLVSRLSVWASPTSEVIKVDLFDVENGLSQTAVQAIIQDSQGYLWVGTQNGLNRFDGYSFKIYRNQPHDSSSIANDNINALCEDSRGNIWVGTFNGLCLYNPKNDNFINYLHQPLDETSISSNRIFDVYEDKFGVVWVKTAESLDKYNPQTNSFTRHYHFVDVFSHSTETNDFAIFEDSKNRFWVGTRDGLMLFDRQLGLFKQYSCDSQKKNSISSNRIKDIFEDTNSNLWIATSNGINLYREKTDDFVRYVHQPGNLKSLPNNSVNVLFEDSRGSFWVGTELGFCQFFPSKGEFTQHFNASVKEKFLYSATVTTVIEDNTNIIWIGTLSGLIKLDVKSQNFKSYSKFTDGSTMFSGNYISSIFKDDKGIIWVGTWGTGLHLFDRKNNTIVRYTESLHSNRICNDYIHVIYRTRKGEVLIGTRNGVQVFQPSTRTFSNFFSKNPQEALRIFEQNRVYSIIEDKEDNLWFATRMGLHKYNRNTFESFYHNPSKAGSISSNEVHALVLDDEGFIWAGTFNGLNRINPKTNEIDKYLQENNNNEKSLINTEVVSLLADSRGDIWIGTVSGLHRFLTKSQTFELYTEREGLPNNLIYAVEEDNSGNIWLSTNWGIAKLNPSSKTVTSFGVSDGLQSYEFNIGAKFKAADNELFFGGTNGFSSFYPDSIVTNTKIPLIAITNIEMFGPQGRVVLPVQGVDELVVNDDFSLINIEFTSFDFSRPEKNKYKYMMEGVDYEWIDIGNKRSATYSSLGEGVYNFKVKGSNSDNIWNEEGVSLKIVVKTKFWKTKVAIWIYGFIVIFSLFLFIRTRTQMLKKTNRLLKERELTMAESEKQKEELLLKNKSITDSIHYAKRIQESLIPTEENFRKILPDSFILFLPKDIVSGDFYWVNETQNKIFVAVVDCTGHGVPGAFMSIIGVELLRSITNMQGINDAAEILNRLNKGVYDTFKVGIGESDKIVKDGMDVSFCVLDKENNTVQFAGAFTCLYVVRDNNIIEIKGDRFSVGMLSEPGKSLFNSHYVPVEPDDMIYMFTDGYVDQFGGSESKKYKFRRFRHLLLNIHKLPFDEQKKHLHDSIVEWRGEHEQVDDILIIGIKPDLSCFF